MDCFWVAIEKISSFFMNAVLKLLHKKWKEEQWNSFFQFVKFGIVGVSNTFISYVINVIVLVILNPFSISWDYFAGNIIAFILSVLWSFYWNNKYVFVEEEGKKRCIWKALFKTYVSYAVSGIVLANLLSWIWVSVLGISKFIAPMINLIISVPLNFILNKLWAFKGE